MRLGDIGPRDGLPDPEAAGPAAHISPRVQRGVDAQKETGALRIFCAVVLGVLRSIHGDAAPPHWGCCADTLGLLSKSLVATRTVTFCEASGVGEA